MKIKIAVLIAVIFLGFLNADEVGQDKGEKDQVEQLFLKETLKLTTYFFGKMNDEIQKQIAESMKTSTDKVPDMMARQVMDTYKEDLKVSDKEAEAILANKFDDEKNKDTVEKVTKRISKLGLSPEVTGYINFRMGSDDPPKGIELEFLARILSKHLKEAEKKSASLKSLYSEMKPQLIAHYPLTGNGNEKENRFDPVKMHGIIFKEDGAFCKGNYRNSKEGLKGNYCQLITPQLTRLNLDAFKISVEFKVLEYPKKMMPVIVGGDSYRWIKLYINQFGSVDLDHHGGYLSTGFKYNLNEWNLAELCFEKKKQVIEMFINGHLAAQVKSQIKHDNDKNIGITDFSNGELFQGYLRNLKIFNYYPLYDEKIDKKDEIDKLVLGLANVTPGGMEFTFIRNRIIAKGEVVLPYLMKYSKTTELNQMKYTEEMNENLREGCIRVLGKIGGKEAGAFLVSILDDETVFDAVCIALEYAQYIEAVKALRPYLNKKLNENSRARLIITLGKLGDAKVVPDLISLLRPASLAGHRYGANEALQKIAGIDFKKDYRKAAEWYEQKTGKTIEFAGYEPWKIDIKADTSNKLKAYQDIIGVEVSADQDYLNIKISLRGVPDISNSNYVVKVEHVTEDTKRQFFIINKILYARGEGRLDHLFKQVSVWEHFEDGSAKLVRMVMDGYKIDKQNRTLTYILPRGKGIEVISKESKFAISTKKDDQVFDSVKSQ